LTNHLDKKSSCWHTKLTINIFKLCLINFPFIDILSSDIFLVVTFAQFIYLQQYFSLYQLMLELVSIIFRWKWHLVAVCLLAGLISAITFLLKPNYYKSTAVFLAANPYNIDRASIFSRTPGEYPVYLFGNSQEIDRLISIGRSTPLIQSIISEFNLQEHYKVDAADPLAIVKTTERFMKNYNILKNALDAIEVIVEDIDAELAANIANTIVKKIDFTYSNITNKSKTDLTQTLQHNIDALKLRLKEIDRQIKENPNNLNFLQQTKTTLVNDLNEAETIKAQYNTLANSETSAVYILENAVASVKKSRPKRTLGVLSTILATLVIGVSIVVILEQLKKFNATGN